jgi:hypothetical protein
VLSAPAYADRLFIGKKVVDAYLEALLELSYEDGKLYEAYARPLFSDPVRKYLEEFTLGMAKGLLRFLERRMCDPTRPATAS